MNLKEVGEWWYDAENDDILPWLLFMINMTTDLKLYIYRKSHKIEMIFRQTTKYSTLYALLIKIS